MKMNTFRELWVICLGAMCAAVGAAEPLEVRSMSMAAPAGLEEPAPNGASWGNLQISMPYVSCKQPCRVAARINEALFIDLMGLPAPGEFSQRFTPLPEQMPKFTVDQDFEVVRNDSLILSFKFAAEICIHLCRGEELRYSFDARNGRALTLADLLTSAARDALFRRIIELRARLYGERLAKLRADLARQRDDVGTDGSDDVQEEITHMQKCREDEQVSGRHVRIQVDAIFHVDGNDMVLKTPRCASFSGMDPDKVGDVEMRLSPKDLAGWLTPYGRTMVLGLGNEQPPASPFGQVLHGTIGDSPVTLMLWQAADGQQVSVGYFEDQKPGEEISLSGKPVANSVELVQGWPLGNQARMTLTWRGTRVSGHWQSKGESLPVTLDWEPPGPPGPRRRRVAGVDHDAAAKP